MKTFTLLLVVAVATVTAHDYGLGECHPVQPMQDFDMDKMLGMWYAIQKVGTPFIECLTYNFTKGIDDDVYYVIQDSQNSVMKKTPLKHRFRHTGKLTADNTRKPAEMKAQFKYNLAGSSKFIFFDTDYETYAGIYTCQDLWIAKRYSATILSRQPTLNYQYVEKLRNKLARANMNPFALDDIDQEAKGCKNKFRNAGADDIFETRRERLEEDKGNLWNRVEIFNE